MSLKINNISKKYDDTWILKDISLEANKGEILGIFGASGSGKSVLIRLISGLENSDNGRILMLDDDVTKHPCDERGFKFPNLSNESFWQKAFGSAKPSELAEGEGQVLALEAALQEVEGVLLLDNSFCQMDRLERDKSYERLRKFTRDKSLIVIFATNDYQEIFKVCDRVAVLNNGNVQQTGTPEEIYLNPNSKSIAGIFGDNNIFPARLIDSGKNELSEFVTLRGEHRISTAKIGEKDLIGANQIVNLAIRPEHISISFGASFPEDNLIKATVKGVRFGGATTKIILDAEGLILKTLVLRLVGLNIGDQCMVGIPPDRIQIYKD